jgi:leader peptidase (prepilin peptidase)/N-methyltransferase
MEDVIIGRRGRKPLIAVGQSLIHPGIQKSARIRFIATPANVLQAPLEGKNAAIVVRSPPGVLVATYFLFKPGHSLLAIEYRGVRKTCQTRALLPVCFTTDAAGVVAAPRVWQSQSVILLGAFLFGLVVGSFLNVCILRIPEDKSIVLPSSSCTKCGKPIAPYDNIPVLSWLILKGKCRNCKAKISIMYPAVELLTGLLFLACVLVFGLTIDALKWATFSAVLVVLTITDLRERILPDSVNLFGVIAGLLFSFFTKPTDGTALWIANRWFDFPPPQPVLSFADAILGALVGSGLLWVVAEGYFRLRGREGMGLGDVKMMAAVGVFLGLKRTLMTVLAGSLLGSVIGIVLISLSKKDRNYELPFGTFLGAGALLVLFFGTPALQWYQSLMAVK